MSETSLHTALVGLVLGLAPIVGLALLFQPAPYGRHARPGWGPQIDTRLAWVAMEAPAVVAFLLFYFAGPRALDPAPLVMLGLWQIHYVHRTFVYPFASGARRGATPLAIVAMGFAFNVVNAWLNATWLTKLGPGYGVDWLTSPAFVAGSALFLAGFAINREADRRLRALKEHEGGGYGMPRGWLFERVSCPNYLGEIVEWCGWALLTFSPAGLAFAVFTFANLAPRARAHHRFYRERFPDYPPRRRALLPLALAALALALSPAALAQEPAPASAWDQAEALFARRAEGARGALADAAHADAAVAAYRRALAEAPGDLSRLAGLLRALHFRGAYCGAQGETRRAFFDEGRKLAQAAIDALEKPLEERPEAERLQKLRAVPGVAGVYYWSTANWGEWALLAGKFAAARSGVAGKVRDQAATAAALDPGLDEGGGDRVLGRLHDQTPKIPFVTGWVNKRKAMEHLRRSLAIGPESRTTWVFLGEAMLDHEPEKRAEALALLRRAADEPPRPERAVEDAYYAEQARLALAKQR